MTLDTLEIALLSVLIFCFIAQLLFYWVILAKPYYYIRYMAEEKLQNLTEKPPVSIIICVKNSRYDLLRFLPDILEQEYPEFEVIIVTDGISDVEKEVLIRLKNRYANLYSTHIPEDTRNISRKKLALTLGIKAAKYDNLLFTEPDSRTRTKDWIFSMARHFSDKKNIVLGFSAINNAKSFWQEYMAYDYFFSGMQMISFALFNHPYAGYGRNMAYAKKHFVEHKGFVKYRVLQQGEDDLFINEIATCDNTAVELSAQSVTFVEIDDFYDWKRQKSDRMATRRYYKRGPVAFWRSESYLRTGFFVAFVACFIYGLPFTSRVDFLLPGIALFLLTARLFSQFFIINRTAEHLQLSKFCMAIPMYDLLQPVINLYFFIYLILKEKENYTYRYEKR